MEQKFLPILGRKITEVILTNLLSENSQVFKKQF